MGHIETQLAVQRMQAKQHTDAMRRDLRDTCIAHMVGKHGGALTGTVADRVQLLKIIAVADQAAELAYPEVP